MIFGVAAASMRPGRATEQGNTMNKTVIATVLAGAALALAGCTQSEEPAPVVTEEAMAPADTAMESEMAADAPAMEGEMATDDADTMDGDELDETGTPIGPN